MARGRDPFGMALARLREDVRDGRIRPGDPLVTTELAASLRISPTPVREALSRLTGEGLLEDRRGRGVYALRYGPAEIEDLTRLHGAFVDLALRLGGDRRGRLSADVTGASPPVEAPQALRSRTERFWAGVVNSADSSALEGAHRRLKDQLAVVRLIEAYVIEDVTAELDALHLLARAPASRPLQRAALEYHRRRQSASREIAAALREWMTSDSNIEQL